MDTQLLTLLQRKCKTLENTHLCSVYQAPQLHMYTYKQCNILKCMQQMLAFHGKENWNIISTVRNCENSCTANVGHGGKTSACKMYISQCASWKKNTVCMSNSYIIFILCSNSKTTEICAWPSLTFKYRMFSCVSKQKEHPQKLILYIQTTRKFSAFLRHAA